MIAPGTMLLPREGRTIARRNKFDPRAAMAQVLACYLGSSEFVRWGGVERDSAFKLVGVLEEWPDPGRELVYPSASVIDAGATPFDDFSFTPMAMEETWNVFAPDTVLWKIGEVSHTFQVDFWTDNVGDREAIAADLPGLFSPGESSSRVVLAGSPQYYDLPVRASFVDYERIDTPSSVYESERRLLARIQCDIDVVELRCASRFAPRIVLDTTSE